MKCNRCGENVEVVKIGTDNWSAGCECWTCYSVTPMLAQMLYRCEFNERFGRVWIDEASGTPPETFNLSDLLAPDFGKLQLVGPADC